MNLINRRKLGCVMRNQRFIEKCGVLKNKQVRTFNLKVLTPIIINKRLQKPLNLKIMSASAVNNVMTMKQTKKGTIHSLANFK
jgi:hypothetical protein